jgi:hypothetical protein
MLVRLRQRDWLTRQVLPGACALWCACAAAGAQTPAAESGPGEGSTALVAAAAGRWPMLLGVQYTFIEQRQTGLASPYEGPLSLHPDGDRQGTHTLGLYTGWAPVTWAQLYLDTEKFMGAGVSGATGLGGPTNGDVVRQGVAGLKKQFYIARLYARLMVPLDSQTTAVEGAQDRLPGREAATRMELRLGRLAVPDDLDANRYAGSTRTAFMNWSLWQNTAWDYAANTRGFTDGVMLGYISPGWSLKYGMYRMPLLANGQTLQTLARARGENLELTVVSATTNTVVRVLGFRNTARLGDYREALAIAAATGAVPDVAATDRNGRHKYGFGVNAEQALADDGETGAFARLGWNDGRTEDFAFTEVDRHASAGAQLAGTYWQRPADRLGAALAAEGLATPHRAYLAAGGAGFLLGDGRLSYAREQILEAYYRAQWSWTRGPTTVRAQLTPDLQFVRNPGFNHDRGPVRFYALRLHLEY